MINVKRGIKWDRSQIRVTLGSFLSFFTPARLYSCLNNVVVIEHENY
jgi:hypothetical protein